MGMKGQEKRKRARERTRREKTERETEGERTGRVRETEGGKREMRQRDD